jgi:large-conductance mechanosensitive channel
VVLGGVCCELLLANGCFVGTVEDGMPVGGMLSVVNFIIIAQLLFVLLTYVTEVG